MSEIELTAALVELIICNSNIEADEEEAIIENVDEIVINDGYIIALTFTDGEKYQIKIEKVAEKKKEKAKEGAEK